MVEMMVPEEEDELIIVNFNKRAKRNDYIKWLIGYLEQGGIPTHYHDNLEFSQMELFMMSPNFKTNKFEFEVKRGTFPSRILVPKHEYWP